MSRDDSQKAQDFTAMGHSEELITDIVAGNRDSELSASRRQEIVDTNVEHLELMVALADWGSEDMTAINAAITAGNGYTAS